MVEGILQLLKGVLVCRLFVNDFQYFQCKIIVLRMITIRDKIWLYKRVVRLWTCVSQVLTKMVGRYALYQSVLCLCIFYYILCIAYLNGRERAYSQFIFYKYFFANPKPLIVTEGRFLWYCIRLRWPLTHGYSLKTASCGGPLQSFW